MIGYTLVFYHPISNQILQVVSSFISLEAVVNLAAPGGLSLILDTDQLVFTPAIDTRIALYRKRKATNYLVGLYFIRSVQWRLDGNGIESLILTAEDTNALLGRRIIAYATGSSQSKKTGPADNIMRAIVRENAGSSAPTARQIQNLAVESDTGFASSVAASFAWRNLIEALDQIRDIAFAKNGERLWWQVQPDSGLQTFTFRVYKEFIHDRRATSNYSVLVSPKAGNVKSALLENNFRETQNYIYAGGYGTESNRLIVEVSDNDQISLSPWNRCEGFFDGANYQDSSSLGDAARRRLAESRGKLTFNAELRETPNFLFGRDFIPGDAITVQAYGQHDAVIRGVRLRSSANEETLETILEEL